VKTGRAVVTGGAGFVGSHLCDRLLAEGWSVVCVDSLLTGNRDNITSSMATGRFSFVEADVTAELDVDGGLDRVLHIA
jgi:dTDP-glucose 4,6-dehydratase